jgi:hypothetical protein
MSRSGALALGIGSFVACIAFCIALFAWLDVELIFLFGPAIAIAIACYGAYKTALEDGPSSQR